jgi:hypothetical protein
VINPTTPAAATSTDSSRSSVIEDSSIGSQSAANSPLVTTAEAAGFTSGSHYHGAMRSDSSHRNADSAIALEHSTPFTSGIGSSQHTLQPRAGEAAAAEQPGADGSSPVAAAVIGVNDQQECKAVAEAWGAW